LQNAPGEHVAAGEWVDAAPYKFRLTSIQRCREAGAPVAVRPPSADGPARRLGFVVQVMSKYDGLLVHPRDVSLQKDGVIFQSEPPDDDCGRALRPRSMKHDETISGMVTFQLPDDQARSAKLVYQATRWGGAPPAETTIPDCLDACPKGQPTATDVAAVSGNGR
jgi:hypothetical protein